MRACLQVRFPLLYLWSRWLLILLQSESALLPHLTLIAYFPSDCNVGCGCGLCALSRLFDLFLVLQALQGIDLSRQRGVLRISQVWWRDCLGKRVRPRTREVQLCLLRVQNIFLLERPQLLGDRSRMSCNVGCREGLKMLVVLARLLDPRFQVKERPLRGLILHS